MGLIEEHSLFTSASELSPSELATLGKTLIIAPHQDDESLGCGGLIRLLTQLEIPVHVLFVSDGSMSHPNSKEYAAEKLVNLREKESVEALQILGVNQDQITFLRLKDSQLPGSLSSDFEKAVDLIHGVFQQFEPKTIFVPWQRDPHPDHRSTWQIVNQATTNFGHSIRKLEYFIWLWERAGDNDLPMVDEGKIWKVNIESVKDYKKSAIAAHKSQTTSLIDDDPEGFTLSAEVLAHFDTDFEIFFETKN